jgi:purine-binding chemotaxis protein CheW
VSHPQQLSTFRIADRLFGIDVGHVQEALKFAPLTRVPLAPPGVGGLLNLRGHIVTALDLRQRLALPPRAPGARPMNLILRAEDGPLSLMVDEIDEVISVDPAWIEPVPATLTGPGSDLLICVLKAPGGLVLVLDAERAVRLGALAEGETAHDRRSGA